MRKSALFIIGILGLFSASCQKACSKQTSEQPSVYFENLKDGDKVTSPFEVKFGVKGMTVRPAMEDINDKTSGHHHILIDQPQGFIEEGQAIPVDEKHIHYGKGQTSGMIELAPGIHSLSLQFADGAHRSYGKKMAATISVTVLVPENKPVEEKPAEPIPNP